MKNSVTSGSRLLRTASLALVALGLCTAVPAEETRPARPNVLLLLADNWAWPHASACGDKSVSTPTFDRIAENGALFRYTFCQVPSCSAARAVLLTGQAMHRLGEAANLWGRFPAHLQAYPRLLEKNGYTTGYTIKGWGPGFYKGKKNSSVNPAGNKYESFAAFLKKAPADKPFCFWFGSHDPHQPWNRGAKFRAGLDPDKVEVPPYVPDHPVVRNTIVDYYAEVQRFDHECGQLIELLKSRRQLANTLVMMVGDNGWQMPRGLANIYDAGTRVPMAVQWPERIKGGQSLDHFISFEDFAPTFLAAAGLPAREEMTGSSFLPLVTGTGETPWRSAVFLERERHANVRAGNRSYPCRAIRTKQHLYVRNLEPELWAAGDPKTHWAVGPYGDIDNTPIKELILSQRNKPEMKPFFELGFLKRPPEELYDLSKDPHQVNNIAAVETYSETKRELAGQLASWMKDTADPRAGDPTLVRFDSFEYFGRAARQKAPTRKKKKAPSRKKTPAKKVSISLETPIRHSFLGVGNASKAVIVGEDGTIEWKVNLPASDGWVLPGGNVLLALYRTKGFPNGGVVEIDRKTKKIVFEYKGQQKETSTVQALPGDQFLISELGPQPRAIVIDRAGKVLKTTPLQCQKKNFHMQTRMLRLLPNGNYIAPHLLDFAVKEYEPGTGKVVRTFPTDDRGRARRDWPFTAIRLENGNTLIGCTNGNRIIEVDGKGKIVWSVDNDDIGEKLFDDACGVQRLPNGNTVITSYHANGDKVKLFEVTREKKVAWRYSGMKTGFHHFQILTTNGKPLKNNTWK